LIVPFVVSLSNHNSYFLLLVPMRRMGTPPLPALQAVINMQDGQEMFGDAAHGNESLLPAGTSKID
jgi:hypothetical protein